MFTALLGVFLSGFLATIVGGVVGATVGDNYASILTGFYVLALWGVFATTGSSLGFDYIPFSPFTGSHIAFVGGAAATACARYKGCMENGKDVNSPLAGLRRPGIIYIGSIFDILDYIVQIGTSKIPWFGGHTDPAALTVLISGILARIVFGGDPDKGLVEDPLHSPHIFALGAGTFLEKIKPGLNGCWLEWQEHRDPLIVIDSLFDILAGAMSIFLAVNVPGGAAFTNTFVFGISVVIILFFITNRNTPVQHHVTNIAGLAAVQFFPVLIGNDPKWTAAATWDPKTWIIATLALVTAGIFGILNTFAHEFFARLWYNRGTPHIDPPTASIWICNTVVVSLTALF